MKPNLEKLLKHVMEAAKNNGPGVVITGVYHDDWCPCSDGTRNMLECICDPDIATLPKPNRQQRRRPGK